MKIVKLSVCALIALPTVALADPSMSDFYWVKSSVNAALPDFAVQGGHDSNGAPLYICQAKHNGGVHPGKIVNGNCNITYAGIEIVKPKYQVLVSTTPLNWVKAGGGFVPPGAVPGGYENGHPLFICKAKYADGSVHPGKIVGNTCNYGYAGKEILSSTYKVLVS